MPLEDFILRVYCWVDEQITCLWPEPGWRRGGFAPALSDAEVLTMELVGEFLGLETEQGIWAYFRTHWRGHFPRLGSRSQWAKQAKNGIALKKWTPKIRAGEVLLRGVRMKTKVKDSIHGRM